MTLVVSRGGRSAGFPWPTGLFSDTGKMAETKIEWTHLRKPTGQVVKGYTYNHWRGCQHAVLPGGEGFEDDPACGNCYAELMSRRNPKVLGVWGKEGTRVLASEAMRQKPFEWNAAAKRDGYPRLVFAFSLGDVFENWMGQVSDHHGEPLWVHEGLGDVRSGKDDGWMAVNGWRPLNLHDCRRNFFQGIVDRTPWLIWLVLTKRPENIVPFLPRRADFSTHRSNVWLGTSIGTNVAMRMRAMILAASRRLFCDTVFWSVEPQKEELDAERFLLDPAHSPDWVIGGGESGGFKDAHPYHIDWAKSLIDQCQRAGVAYFQKQLGRVPVIGENTPEMYRAKVHLEMEWPEGTCFGNPTSDPHLNGRVVLLKHDKGGDIDEWPASLQVRRHPYIRIPAADAAAIA